MPGLNICGFSEAVQVTALKVIWISFHALSLSFYSYAHFIFVPIIITILKGIVDFVPMIFLVIQKDVGIIIVRIGWSRERLQEKEGTREIRKDCCVIRMLGIMNGICAKERMYWYALS